MVCCENPDSTSGVSIGVITGTLPGIDPMAPAATRRPSISPGISMEDARSERTLSGDLASLGRESSKSLISSMRSIGVIPQMASGENMLKRSATAPTNLPSI
jgi:hypothetical protein